jgi:hypothetical protein
MAGPGEEAVSTRARPAALRSCAAPVGRRIIAPGRCGSPRMGGICSARGGDLPQAGPTVRVLFPWGGDSGGARWNSPPGPTTRRAGMAGVRRRQRVLDRAEEGGELRCCGRAGGPLLHVSG